MKIEINTKKIKFSELYAGDCFMNKSGNDYLMKLSDDEDTNAVSLKDADVWHFYGDEIVIPVNARVVIE